MIEVAALLDQGENLLSTNFKNFDNNLPLLMTWGTQDRLTSMEAGKEFFDEVQCKDKLFKTFDGCYHERKWPYVVRRFYVAYPCIVHNEPEKDEIIQYYIDWILEHAKNWAETKKN
jgi:acylglycerol lipase